MSVDTAAPHLNDPVFQEALKCFQDGAWDQGLEKLDALIRQFPAESELQDLRQEMTLRARLDQDEEADQKVETMKRIARWGLGGAVIFAMVALIFWGLSTYSSRIEGQWGRVRQNLVAEVEALDLAVRFQDAQNYLSAGRPQDALLLAESIAEQNPDYPGLNELETEAARTIDLEAKYQNAAQLLAQGDISAALALLQEIQAEHNGYKDVSLQIQELENEIILNDLFSQAEQDFAEGDWENAIVYFESLRSTAPKYQSERVQEHLVESYVNAATQILDTESLSSDALILADQYFRKALVLKPMDSEILLAQDQALSDFKERLFLSYIEKARAALVDNADSLAALATANAYYDLALDMRPNDPEVIRERQLATAYLGAQQSFLNEDWDAVITGLELVYEQDKSYADGTSSQTLYDAYMRRGRRSIANGEYEAAIEDYQRASEIAGESPEAVLQVYWSLIEMAEVYGILGEYEKADNLYHHAVEWIGFRDIVQGSNPELIVLLDEAERYAGIEWFRTAYRLYTRVLPAEDLIYSAVYHDVQEGDYLTQIASEYRTTVEAILAANEISNPGDIRTGQRILVPILRGDQD